MGALIPARHPLFNRWMVLGIFAAFLAGLLAVVIFGRMYTSVPAAGALHSYALIAASIAVDLVALGVTLTLLPTALSVRRYPWLLTWIQSSLLSSAGVIGMALAPGHHESARTFLALGLLFIGQSGAVIALHGILTTFLFPRELLARQAILLIAGALVTALFWSRGVIHAVEQSSPTDGAQRAEVLTDGVMKLSPPPAICATWYVESDAGTQLSGGRFDLIHSPLTYKEWVGITGKQVAYPDILPPAIKTRPFSTDNRAPGLALALIVWSLAVILLSDALARRRG
jgi:hypothetical protein